MSTAEWFCKIADREIGPLTSEQLAHMGRAEQLLPTDQVRKGRSGEWVEARRVKGLTFGPADTTPPDDPPPPTPVPAEPKQESAAKYYAFIGQKRNGPFTLEQLTRQLLPSDVLVWRQGLKDWVPLREVPELEEFLPPPDPVAAEVVDAETGPPEPPSSPLVVAQPQQVAANQTYRPPHTFAATPAKKSKTNNAGEVVGTVIAVVLGIVAVCLVLWFFTTGMSYVKTVAGGTGMFVIYVVGYTFARFMDQPSSKSK